MTIPPPSCVSDTSKSTSPTINPLAAPPAPLDGFDASEFSARRQALRSACNDGIIVIRGSTEDQVAMPAVYSQNPTFFYLTGVDTPGAFLVLLPEDVSASSAIRDADPGVKEILFLPDRNTTLETWTGPKLGPGKESEQATGIAKVVKASEFLRTLTAWIRRNATVYTLMPFGANARASREFSLTQEIAALAPVVQFRDCSIALTALRMVKSSAELDRIREAIAVTTAGQRAARDLIHSGNGNEFDVEAEILKTFRSHDSGPAFHSIVGCGFNGTVLHYELNSAPLVPGVLVVVDIGAKVGHYCGDITRAYPVGGEVSARHREIHDLVVNCHEDVISGYRPGLDTLQTLGERAKQFLKESPIRAKDSAGAEQAMDTFMPHSLGHHLGLDVHDPGETDLPLRAGNVITVEPGIYIPSEGIGVRIEDDYLITETGMERLGPPLDRALNYRLQ